MRGNYTEFREGGKGGMEKMWVGFQQMPAQGTRAQAYTPSGPVQFPKRHNHKHVATKGL